MTDETQTTSPTVDELTILKGRAKTMGITFSNNIGIDALRAKIAAVQDGTDDTTDENGNEQEETVNALDPNAAPEIDLSKLTPQQRKAVIRRRLQQENMKLIRIRITCMNPAKKDLQGEIFTVANGYLGTVRRFIPYGEAAENGWHIEKILLKMLQRKQYQSITKKKDPQTKREYVHSAWVREFAIEELPPLTEEELARLANAQAAAGSID